MSNCIFCDIVSKKAKAYIIEESEHAIAILDAFPLALGHCLIISKKHYDNLTTCDPVVLADMIQLCQKVARKIKQSSLAPIGFNYAINEGRECSQMIDHVHFHIMPGYGKKIKWFPLEEVYKIIKSV